MPARIADSNRVVAGLCPAGTGQSPVTTHAVANGWFIMKDSSFQRVVI